MSTNNMGPTSRSEWSEREWISRFPTVSDFGLCFYLAAGVFFIVDGLGRWAGLWAKISVSLPAFIPMLGGLWLIAPAAYFLVFASRRATTHLDGGVTFVSRRRVLEVGPGELQSITAFGNDWFRIFPMKVKASRGRILFRPPPREKVALFAFLAASNPNARLARP